MSKNIDTFSKLDVTNRVGFYPKRIKRLGDSNYIKSRK